MRKLTITLTTAILIVFLTVSAFAWTDMIMGKPAINPAKDDGIFFWLDKDGLHVRVSSPKKTVFTGAIVTPIKVELGKLDNMKKGDSVKKYMGPSYLDLGEIKDWNVFFTNLKSHKAAPWKRIFELLPEDYRKIVASQKKGEKMERETLGKIMDGINKVIMKKSIYDEKAFKGVTLSPEALGYIKRGVKNLNDVELQRLNRLLIEAINKNGIIPSTKEMIKFQFTVTKEVKGFDFKTKSPYLDFMPCKMNNKLIKKQNFFSGKKKQNLEHTPFRIYDLGNPDAKMPFPH